MSESDSKKLLCIRLEPDMFFEIADQLKDRLTQLEYAMTSPHNKYHPNPKIEQQYYYLKSIVSLLEIQLTT